VRQVTRQMPREDSDDVSDQDLIDRSQRSVEPYLPSGKVSRASAPLTVKGNLDVDAVLERSIRKVSGE
jgi:hypothetical protein